MTKYYCDGCGKQITMSNDCSGGAICCEDSRLGTTLKTKSGKVLKIEIMTAMDDRWNDGHFCRHCVIDALLTLDDRKQKKSR